MSKVIALLMVWPFSAAVAGHVTSILWRWFVVPLGLEPIGVAHAYGLGLLFVYLTSNLRENDDRDALEAVVFAVSLTVTKALVALGGGWVALQFLGVPA